MKCARQCLQHQGIVSAVLTHLKTFSWGGLLFSARISFRSTTGALDSAMASQHTCEYLVDRSATHVRWAVGVFERVGIITRV